MPVPSRPDVKMPLPDERATLDFMPGSRVPVIRQRFVDGDLLPFWAYAREYETLLFDRYEDPHETDNRIDSALTADAEELLRVALQDVQAPSEQFERLGLS